MESRDFRFLLPAFKKIYYPGSGKDKNTLMFILSEFPFVEDIVFCDYVEHLSTDDLMELGNWEILKIINLEPSDFKKNNWSEFRYPDDRSMQVAEPNQMESKLYILLNRKSNRVVRFFQLGTEALGTYQVICRSGIRPNLIFLADYGFGGNWHPNIWGEAIDHSEKKSFLKSMAKLNQFIMIDRMSTIPWENYLHIPSFTNDRWDLYRRNREIDGNLKY
jgi:hypothetical protein